MSRIVTNHVAAGNPRRHLENLALWVGLFYRQANFVQVCPGVFRPNTVLVHGAHAPRTGSFNFKVRHLAEPPAFKNSVNSTS